MKLQQVLANRMSIKPSKRKIVKTIYATDRIAKEVQKDLPKETRFIAQNIYEGCNRLRNSLTKQ